jgi:hypothetical protein
MALPIYYRNHLYTDAEREELWLMKLDKEIRWVNGVKIDVSNGYEDYFRCLEEARKLNITFGFGH